MNDGGSESRAFSSYKPDEVGADYRDRSRGVWVYDWHLLLLTVLLHDAQEAQDDARGRADKHLTLTLALGVDDSVQSIVLYEKEERNVNKVSVGGTVLNFTYQDGNADHDVTFVG